MTRAASICLISVALVVLETSLAQEPGDVINMAGAAQFSMHLGRMDQAIVLAEFAARRDPASPTRHANLGNFYFLGGRLDEAIASIRTVLTLRPGYMGGHKGIAVSMCWPFEAKPTKPSRGWKRRLRTKTLVCQELP